MRFYLIVKGFFKIYKAPLFSGVLVGCSFIPFPFVAWFFALVPLWFFIYQQKVLKRVLIGAFLTQFVATLVGFNWVMLTVHIFGQVNLFFSFLALLLFCCFANLYILISSWLWYLLSRKAVPSVKLILFPVLFPLFHSLIPTLFPWDMGYPWLWSGFWGFQTAELWGFRFFNTLFYVFNLLFLIVFYHSKRKKSLSQPFKKLKSWFLFFELDQTGKKALGTAFFLFLFLNLLGFYLKKRLPDPDGSLKVILVQHNWNLLLKKEHRGDPQARSLLDLRKLTYHALKRRFLESKKLSDIDLVLWPEGAYPYPIRTNDKQGSLMGEIIRPVRVPIITGGLLIDSDQKVKNSVFAFDRKGVLLEPVYSKMKLLAFGETFPLIDRFPVLRKVFPYFGGSMKAGDSIQVTSLEGVSYGWPICYEVLFDKLVRGFSKNKSQVLINVSNDSWYGYPQQPFQHLTMSFARAIELRQPLLRATNTGFSGVIFANGKVQKHSPFNQAWAGYYEVPYYKTPLQTLFMGWGYYINEIFLLCLVLWIGFLQKNSAGLLKKN